MESLHSNYSDTTDSDTVRHVSYFAKLLNDCGSRKVFIMTVCVLLTCQDLKRLSDNIRKNKRVVFVKISSHNASFTSNHFEFNFLWRLVSDDFCNLSATRVLIRTNGEDC